MSQRDEARAREEILWAIGMHCSHTGEPLPEPAEPCPSCSLITSEVLERIEARAAALLGYSRPRVVETIKELEALPVWSVVRDRRKYTLERCDHGWFIPGRAGYRDARDIALPATVRYLPEEAK
ncbi:hypothetical protein [Prescottella agglutinans]|uniref:Helix-turn-helix DNA binding domain protein n=1 Tax=Prescottella agglutinans TaxID=1644129 RepID=A0ABT6MF59_9NOCA|nr:hypothetical protein [Prescottella agglutinans]MDH6282907.1 hypothetical protein [Prescottella agglutinans]